MMKQTIRLETVIDWPVEREKEMRKALQELPDVMVDNLRGWNAFSEACQRLEAAEKLVKQSEQAMRDASKALRECVYDDWKESEIPDDTKALLFVW